MSSHELDWVTVPGGPFTMGSDPRSAFPPDADEAPRHAIAVAAFRLGRTPVTNAQFRAYAADTGTASRYHPLGGPDEPVTYVSWDDARAFCDWATVTLPSEAQWERAARGDDERMWPWGDELPDEGRCAFCSFEGPPPVGATPRGASPFAVLDLAGTVWEWTSSAYAPYPYDPADGRERPGLAPRVVRGGSFIHDAAAIRCSARHPLHPGTRDHYVGFRVTAGPTPGPLAFDWVDVPAGIVLLGNDPDPVDGLPVRAREVPQHVVELQAVELSRTPVTNGQYADYVEATAATPPPHWGGDRPPPGLELHPVTYVDWHDARAYSAWAGGRLPTEAEWEKAARGTDARPYPWGSSPDPRRSVVGHGLKHGTTARVDAHPEGASPYGHLDMSGNVWEWVSSAFRPYPYDWHDGREDPTGGEPRVLRGGSYASEEPSSTRCAFRSRSAPQRRQSHIGFRVARD